MSADERRLALFGRVANDRRLRRLVASYGIYSVAEQATWLAITVFAFDRGGVGEAGMVACVMLAPAIVVTPFASAASDRFRTDVVLAAGYGAQASSMICTALAMAMSGPAPVVYGFATLTSVCVTLSRPALGAVLPAATPTPAHLAAARVSIGIADNAGVLIGPALAGVFLIGDSGPAWVFAVMGVSMVAATVLVARLGLARSALAIPLALAVAAGGVAIASMAPMSSLALVAAAFAVCGASTSLADIIGNTLVARLAPSRLLARVYGVMEAARVASVALGSVAVSVDGSPIRVQGPGTGFGEIALVRDVPRTATVTSSTPVTLYCIRRPDFLTALTGNPAAQQAADTHTERRLDEDRTRDRDGNRAHGTDPDDEV